MRAPTISTSQVQLNIKDKLAVFDLPIQTNKYAGTNTGGSGKEGTADDIKDKPKPLLYGFCDLVSPVLVNAQKLIYQIHDGSVATIISVYDSGIGLLFNANRANLAAMEATEPPEGFYDTCTSEGLIRLGRPAVGKLSVTARGDNAGGTYVSTVADIVSRILTTKAGIASASISSTAVSTLNTDANYEVGIFIDSETTIQNVLDDLLISVSGWLAPNREGTWVLGQLKAPTGTPLLTLTDNEIIGLELQSSSDENKSIPIYRCITRYLKYWTDLSDSDLSGAVLPAARAVFTQQWREIKQTDTSVQTKHLFAPELIRETLLTDSSDATAECLRTLNLHKVRRDFIQADIRLDTDNSLLDIGSVIELKTTRLGYSAGKLFYVVGITSDGARNKLSLQLWG
jgi:hypothetical protein